MFFCWNIIDRIEARREIIGQDKSKFRQSRECSQEEYTKKYEFNFGANNKKCMDITAPSTPEAKQWEGWGTALKPALEPITVARKPLSEKNVALNVLKWGTGGINIDATRIDVSKNDPNHRKETGGYNSEESLASVPNAPYNKTRDATLTQGRFPTNFILNGEAGRLLDEQSGELNSGGQKLGSGLGKHNNSISYDGSCIVKSSYFGQKGGASRFFYCAKTSLSERNKGCEALEENTTNDGREVVSDRPHQRGATQRKNHHPTVKPIALMEYLVKLVSREEALVIDPFMGSGTTAIACKQLNRNFIGFELSQEYVDIANKRLKGVLRQPSLFNFFKK